MGRSKAPTTIEESITGICARVCSYFFVWWAKEKHLLTCRASLARQIDEATKEKTSGQFVLHEDGSKLAW